MSPTVSAVALLFGMSCLGQGHLPPPLRPLAVEYRFCWAGVEAGRATIRLTPAESSRWEVRATASTTGVARALWPMNATFWSDPDRNDYRPQSAELIEYYRGKTVRTRLEFSPREVRRDRTVEIRGSCEGTPKRFCVESARDLAGALLAVRALPLNDGDTHTLNLFPAAAAYRARIRVAGREHVQFENRSLPAIRVELELQRIGKDGRPLPVRKFRRARAWLSDDRNRVVLRAEAEVFIGTVSAQLVQIED